MAFEITIVHWAALFLALVLLATYLLKRFAKAETWYVVSLIKTKRFLPLIDRLSKAGRVLDIIADAGLVLGFGAIAVDYMYLRRFQKGKRILLFLASIALLTGLFYLIDFALAGMFSTSPFTRHIFPVLAIVFGFSGFAGFSILALVLQAIDIVAKMSIGQGACPGIAPLIPGVDIPGVPISVPLHAWISLLIILAVHEGMHGVVARRLGIAIKNAGLLLFGFLPIGAFVEPDEEQLKKAPDRSALRVYAAGPTANLISLVVIEILILAIVLFLATFVTPWALPIQQQAFAGVVVAKVDQNVEFCKSTYPAPAYGALDVNMGILKVNDINITSAGKLQTVIMLNRYKPVKFTLEDLNGEVIEKTLIPNELGTFGFSVEERKNPNYAEPWLYSTYRSALGAFDEFIGWLFILSLLIALVNFLPLAVFDGGRIANIMLVPYFAWLGMGKEDTGKFIGRVFLWFILALFVVNALPLFL